MAFLMPSTTSSLLPYNDMLRSEGGLRMSSYIAQPKMLLYLVHVLKYPPVTYVYSITINHTLKCLMFVADPS